MTKENKPKVTIVTGRKSIFKIGLINPFKIVNIILAKIRVVQLEIDMMGKIQAKSSKVIPVLRKGLSIWLFNHILQSETRVLLFGKPVGFVAKLLG